MPNVHEIGSSLEATRRTAQDLKDGRMGKFLIIVFLSLILSSPTANAQFTFARQEVLSFESAMTPVNDFLSGKEGKPVTLAGYLRLPKTDGKNPVVILFHG